MADDEGVMSKERQPRRLLVDPADFGRDPVASWHPIGAGVADTEVIAAYWQHLAVCALRERYPVDTADELRLLGTDNVVYLKRKLSGEYPVPFEELIAWTVGVGDISLLPQLGRIEDLYPPGSLPERPPER